MVLYNGIFLDRDSIRALNDFQTPFPLDGVEIPHVTLYFKPESYCEYRNYIGRSVWFKVIGIGRDEKNFGYKVRVFSGDDVLCDLFRWKPGPLHVTMGINRYSGKAKDTRNLKFEPIPKDKQFLIKGLFNIIQS